MATVFCHRSCCELSSISTERITKRQSHSVQSHTLLVLMWKLLQNSRILLYGVNMLITCLCVNRQILWNETMLILSCRVDLFFFFTICTPIYFQGVMYKDYEFVAYVLELNLLSCILIRWFAITTCYAYVKKRQSRTLNRMKKENGGRSFLLLLSGCRGVSSLPVPF